MMAADVRKFTKQAVDELPEDEAADVLDFISYLRWRREEMDPSWFWTEGGRSTIEKPGQIWQRANSVTSTTLKIDWRS
jgi:hypothetical protein